MRIIIVIIILNLVSWSVYSQNEDPNLTATENQNPDSALQGNQNPDSAVPKNENIDQLESEIMSYLEPYEYDVEGRRDPFQPYIEEVPETDQFTQEDTIQSEVEQPKLPLLRYNLSQLVLKAILWDVKNPKVIVEDPGKKLHVLIKNDKIGNNGGYIASIREGEVVVVQSVSVQGKDIVSTKFMRLKR